MSLALLLSFFVSTSDADALRQTDPADLTIETARVHLAAARVAAAAENVDVDLLLSIAWHESHYDATMRTAEPGQKTSCGVMTPIPKASCATPSLVDGYLEGAAHLRTWLEAAHGNTRTALLGYAGGYRMIKACAEGPVTATRKGHDVDLCDIAEIFLGRARTIRHARQYGSHSATHDKQVGNSRDAS